MNHRTMQLQEAVDEATDTMRAASQALTLMEGTAAEEELCGLLARALSHEADRLAKKGVNSQKVCLRIIHSPRSYSSF